MKRKTSQRQVIRDAFDRLERPLSVQEVYEEARASLPELGTATVYRAVNDLTDAGWLVKVELPGEPVRYERSHLGHHHHFQCRVCERVFDVQDCPGDLSGMAPEGFRVRSHEIVLYGECPSCREAGAV